VHICRYMETHGKIHISPSLNKSRHPSKLNHIPYGFLLRCGRIQPAVSSRPWFHQSGPPSKPDHFPYGFLVTFAQIQSGSSRPSVVSPGLDLMNPVRVQSSPKRLVHTRWTLSLTYCFEGLAWGDDMNLQSNDICLFTCVSFIGNRHGPNWKFQAFPVFS
jgi:hypothetical protein